jgi:hypothetical protein
VRDGVLLAVGAACLAGAAALGALSPPREGAERPAAFGAARVLAVDALFLRADALRSQGRLEEVPGLYRRILDLDPANEGAVDYLADVLARDLRTLAPTAEGRVRWWRAAWDLLADALAKRPGSARLEFRAADLLLLVAAQDAAVSSALAAEGRDRETEGLARLLASIRRAGTLPRWGYLHLDVFVHVAPEIAARRLASGGAGLEDARAAHDAVERTRAGEHADFLADDEPALPALARLRAGRNLVREVRKAIGREDARAAARSLLDAYARVYGENGVVAPLRRRLGE